MINSIFPIVVILLTGMNACTADYDFETDCIVHEYDGGPGQVIATFEPTLPGEISLESSSNAWDIASDIVSNIPIVGGALGSLFGLIGTATDTTIQNMQILEEAINTLDEDIRTTVDDLKTYVDAKFDEYDYDQKTDTLHGILYSAGYCASFGLPDNQEDCLKSLNVDIVELVPIFFPVDPKYETFEQLLPLTRHYIDLQMAVLIDIANLTNLDRDYVNSIATFSLMAYNFYVTTVESIVKEHNESCHENTPVYELMGVKEGNPLTPWCKYFDYMRVTQEWDHGDGCSIDVPEGGSCRYGSCFDCNDVNHIGIQCYYDIKYATDAYVVELANTIMKYWEVDMGQAMENYKKIGIIAGANEDDYLVMGEFSVSRESYIPALNDLSQELQEKSRNYLVRKGSYRASSRRAEAAKKYKAETVQKS